MTKRSPPQRYRVTMEFELRHRRDYDTVRRHFLDAFRALETGGNFQADYMAMEKVEDPATRK